MSFAKNMSKNIGKNVKGKYSQKLLDHAKQLFTDVLKTFSKTVIQKAPEATGDLIGSKIADKSPKHHNTIIQRQLVKYSENIEHDIKIPKERYISPENRQKIIDDLRLI